MTTGVGRYGTLPLIIGLLLLLAIPLLATAAEPTIAPTATTLETSVSLGRATILVNGESTRFTRSWGYDIRRASLTDRYGRRVGRSHLICILIRMGERGCHGTYVFPRGHIMVAGLIQANSYTLAVIGGTSLYDNARGAVRVSPSGAKANHRVFFQLVG